MGSGGGVKLPLEIPRRMRMLMHCETRLEAPGQQEGAPREDSVALMDEPTETANDAGKEAEPAKRTRASRRADDVTPEEAAATVETILFASDTPVKLSRMVLVGQLTPRAIRDAVETLNARYEETACTFRIEEIAGGYQMLTRPEYHDIVARLVESKRDMRLSQAAMETLAIVAYRQPILRADVEAIRGVASGEVIRGLMERQLLKIVGRADVIGRPMLYGTTTRFLELFGLRGLEDLPKVEELRSGAAAAAPDEKPADSADAEAPPEAVPQAEPPAAEEPPAEEPVAQEEPAGQ